MNYVCILYADDTNLLSLMRSFTSSNSLNPANLTEVTNSINDDLSHVHEWLLINKLSVNVSKTKFMIFHHQQRKIDNLIPDLKLDSEPIEHVSGLTLQIKIPEQSAFYVDWKISYPFQYYELYITHSFCHTFTIVNYHGVSEWADINFCRNELYVSGLVVVIMHIETHCLRNFIL